MSGLFSLALFTAVIAATTLFARSTDRSRNIVSGIVMIALSGYFYSLPFLPARLPGLADLYNPYKMIACLVLVLCGLFLILSPPKAGEDGGS